MADPLSHIPEFVIVMLWGQSCLLTLSTSSVSPDAQSRAPPSPKASSSILLQRIAAANS